MRDALIRGSDQKENWNLNVVTIPFDTPEGLRNIIQVGINITRDTQPNLQVAQRLAGSFGSPFYIHCLAVNA
jgi:hypothetical protein